MKYLYNITFLFGLFSPLLLAGEDNNGLHKGQAAIDRLGDRLPDVAKKHNMTAEKLKALLLQDLTLAASDNGVLMFVDETAGLVSEDDSGGGGGSGSSSFDPFMLHSKAGAPVVLYLDFKGRTIENTIWNTVFGPTCSKPSITIAAFSKDADRTTFSDSEKQAILNVWKRVSEDYAPFEIDVTTDEQSLNTHYGIRVLIGGRPQDLVATGCGLGGTGVAQLGSYGNVTSDTPAFVFAESLFNNEKTIADTASHEMGHTLNLIHDGTQVAAYYQGDMATGYGPIMGAPFLVPLTQWSKGEYLGANNTQDDVAIIASKIPYSPDEQGPDKYTAFVAPINTDPADATRGIFSRNAIIEKAADKDVFAIWAGLGPVAVNAQGLSINQAFPGTNLDLSMRVFDASGNEVASSNVQGPIGETVNFISDTNGKFYFVEVDGEGHLTPDVGYSDYGSLGNYQITASFPKSSLVVPPLPDPKLYNLNGFFSPVDNAPVFNQVKAGRSVPVKFALTLKTDGSKVTSLDVLDAGYPKTQAISCSAVADTNVLGDEETLANGGGLKYDAVAEQYVYVLSTSSAWAGTCRQLVVKLKDTQIMRANFQFK